VTEPHEGVVVEATEDWGLYVEQGDRGTVTWRSGRCYVAWDDVSHDLYTTAPVREVSAVERLGELTGG